MSHWIVIIFTFGFSIFYALSMVEFKVWPLIRNRKTTRVDQADVRFVHRALKRLTSLLPPSNGLVILAGTTLLVMQANSMGWSLPSWGILVLYWLPMLYIILVRRNPEVVKFLREHVSETAPLETIRSDVHRVGIDHHIALYTNLAVVAYQLLFLTNF